MYAPSIEMAQTHAAQLRRDADDWRERRLARLGARAAAVVRRSSHR